MKISISELMPKVQVIALEGDVDMSTSPEFRNELLPLFQNGASHIIVDLSRVPYIDSSGIATLVEGLQFSRKKEIRLSLAGAASSVEAVFELAYLKDVFEMFSGVEECLSEGAKP